MPDGALDTLQVDSICTGYGKKPVLRDVSIRLSRGEIVALIGHNGAGKSTLLKALFGLMPVWSGRVLINGQPCHRASPRELLRGGIAYVPQGNRVFSDLTVEQNLELAGTTLPNNEKVRDGLDRALTAFPPLRSRLRQRAGTLSGGEKQMLALASAFVVMPRLLYLDEPSLGLTPPLAADALGRLRQINREFGISMLVVEQKVREILKIAHRVYVLRNGQVSYTGSAESLNDDAMLRTVYL